MNAGINYTIKVCSNCHEEKPATSEYFYHLKSAKDGLQYVCKYCQYDLRKEYHKEYLRSPAGKRSERKRTLKKRYGISVECYEKMLEDQNGVCAICGAFPGKRRLHVDHNHKTGEVRGLLCNNCNVGIGHAQEDITTLKKMIYYLEKGTK